MKTLEEIKTFIAKLRTGNLDGTKSYAEVMNEAADELESMHDLLCKQQVIIRRVYAELLPDTWFVSGELGEKDSNGLPKFIEVCPAYGLDWSQLYEKTDKTIGGMGS